MAASAVLNGARTSSRISEDTRQRILKAAAELSYRPNAAARALANRRMDTIGVATVMGEQEPNQYLLEVLNGILQTSARYEQNATVFTLHDWERDPVRLHRLCDGRIDGLILIAPTFAYSPDLLPAHTPFVSLHANSPLPNVINIESDEENGAYELVRHLLARGHQRILHLAGPSGLLGATRRVRGYRRALAELDIPYRSALVIPGAFEVEDGRTRMRLWLRQNAGAPLPHAIFCANDGIAVGALEALAEAGLRVPEDLSVVGFDDSIAARTTVPQLTTVKQPLRAMGARAVEILLQRVAHHAGDAPDHAERNIVFPTELVVRGSVAAPPATTRYAPTAR